MNKNHQKLFTVKSDTQKNPLTSSFFVCSFCVAPNADPEDVLKRANAAIQKKYEFFETTLQIERFQQDMDDCQQCVGPLK